MFSPTDTKGAGRKDGGSNKACIREEKPEHPHSAPKKIAAERLLVLEVEESQD